MAEDEDLVAEYREYLQRFDSVAEGPTEFGSFLKYRGRLVKKLRYDEFEPMFREYEEVAKAYFDSIDRGDTINDIVVKILRDRATELIKPSPV
jgi:hypothetical protein